MIIGIDPGVSGAIALVDMAGNLRHVHDMPVQAKGSGKKQEVNPAALYAYLQSVVPHGPVVCYIEQVGAMPGQGVTSMFSFGDSFGCARAVVAACGLPIKRVTPQAWKKRFSLTGKEKDMARTICMEAWPAAVEHFRRRKDIGRADAALIALYGVQS